MREQAEGVVVDMDGERWRKALEYRWDNRQRTNVLAASQKNALLILCNDAAFKGCWRYDEFRRKVTLCRTLPPVPGLDTPEPGPIEDHMLIYLVAALHQVCGLSFGRDGLAHAVEGAAAQDPYNSLTDYLDSLTWDGVERIHGWLYTYLGAEHTSYTSAVGRWWLISCMARAYRPGCQADHMLVLEGRQGAGKSTAARVLGGKMFLPKLPNLRDYDRAAHALSGVWIVEVGELDALRGAAATQAKDFISMTSDAYRAPYARYGCTVPRTCIFVGTTNEDGYLGDPTGARRYHPIRVGAVGAVDTKRLERDREQLLAEARSAFERGEEWWPDKEHEEEIEAQQEERYRADEWEAVISRWLEGCRSVRDGVTVGDVLLGAFEMPAEKWDDISQKRVGIAMKRLGWRMERRREGGVKVRRYFRAAGPWTDRAED